MKTVYIPDGTEEKIKVAPNPCEALKCFRAEYKNSGRDPCI